MRTPKEIYDLNQEIRKALLESTPGLRDRLDEVIFCDGGDGGLLIVPTLELAVDTALGCMRASGTFNCSGQVEAEGGKRYFRIGIAAGPLHCRTFMDPISGFPLAHQGGAVLALATRIQSNAVPGTILVEEKLAADIESAYRRTVRNWNLGEVQPVKVKDHEQGLFVISARELIHHIASAQPLQPA